MTWQNGRELAGIKNGRESYTYAYNLSGLRTSKTVHGTSTNYYYDENNNLISTKRVSLIVMFYYDSNGEVYSMSKGGKTYFFIKNIKGDITKIIDEEGNICATYSYDAWGAILEENEDNSIKGINPFRYRGYVYDSETGLYYLQSRYYDPQTDRFINADSYLDTYSGSPLSTNMFAYCENNPVLGYDPSGNWDATDHEKITNKNGFSGAGNATVRSFVKRADSYPFGSVKDKYSAPFHSRPESLTIAKKLYNLALEIKTNKKYKTFIIGGTKTGCTRVDFLKYNSSGSKSDTAKAQKDFFNIINVKNWKEQYQIILGLALHTIQDYLAHCIRVYSFIEGKNGNWGKEKITKGSNAITTVNYWITPSQTLQIEDNINFLNWRYKSAEGVTSSIYTYFTKGWTIKEIKSNYIYQNTSTFYVYWPPNSMKSGKYGKYTTQKPKNNYYAYKIKTGYVALSFTFKK